ncbi:MAG: Ig-like domain-containing protein, partial [Synergistaceae bacterium]|nr:Ig-like domain-containing protein [Synergistaceae bacterium]
MKKFLLVLLGFVLLGSVPLHSAEGAPKNGVVSFSPSGIAADNAVFKIVFDEPVAASEQTGKTLPVSDFPFVVTPSIQAEGQWLDRRTFSATLLAPLEMATRYSAAVREELKSQSGRPIGEGVNFTFQTAPLRLLNATAAQTGDGNVDIQLDFNIPVSPVRLRGFLSVKASDRVGMTHWIQPSGFAAKTLHLFVELGNLYETCELSIRLAAGLTGEAGTLGLPQDEARSFTIAPALRIDIISAEHRAYGAPLRVYASLPIDAEAAMEGGFIKIEPEIPFSIDTYYGSVLNIRGDFKPRGRYVLTFKKGLPS